MLYFTLLNVTLRVYLCVNVKLYSFGQLTIFFALRLCSTWKKCGFFWFKKNNKILKYARKIEHLVKVCRTYRENSRKKLRKKMIMCLCYSNIPIQFYRVSPSLPSNKRKIMENVEISLILKKDSRSEMHKNSENYVSRKIFYWKSGELTKKLWNNLFLQLEDKKLRIYEIILFNLKFPPPLLWKKGWCNFFVCMLLTTQYLKKTRKNDTYFAEEGEGGVEDRKSWKFWY